VFRNTIAGNTYINRNMVGAVVGVNPFGGRGLSGTGPKAGGPNYLLRFSEQHNQITESRTFTVDLSGTVSTEQAQITGKAIKSAHSALKKWQSTSIDARLIVLRQVMTQASWLQQIEPVAREKLANPIQLPGPTGEDNKLSVQGRGVMTLIITQQDSLVDAEKQIASALLCGCAVIVTAGELHQAALATLRDQYIKAGLASDLLQIEPLQSLALMIADDQVEGIIANSLNAKSCSLRQAMAMRSGSIIPLIEWPQRDEDYSYHWLLWFLSERTRTENLVARGGNTQLFNLAE